MPTSTLSRGEVAQLGGHDAHQPVEHDLQHRQALVRDEARADDLLHPGAVLAAGGSSSKPSRLSISAWLSTRAGCGWRLAALGPRSPRPTRRPVLRRTAAVPVRRSLDQHLGEQHIGDACRRGGEVGAARSVPRAGGRCRRNRAAPAGASRAYRSGTGPAGAAWPPSPVRHPPASSPPVAPSASRSSAAAGCRSGWRSAPADRHRSAWTTWLARRWSRRASCRAGSAECR